MKAVYIEQFGGPEVVKYGELPDPTAAAGQVVVDAFAASVNGADWKVRAGHYGKAAFPLVLGRDFSGVVSAVGEGVADLRVGDEVFGVLEAKQDTDLSGFLDVFQIGNAVDTHEMVVVVRDETVPACEVLQCAVVGIRAAHADGLVKDIYARVNEGLEV